jgi:hypothetical protein
MRISAEAREVIRPHIEKNNIPKYRDAYRAGNFPRARFVKISICGFVGIFSGLYRQRFVVSSLNLLGM